MPQAAQDLCPDSRRRLIHRLRLRLGIKMWNRLQGPSFVEFTQRREGEDAPGPERAESPTGVDRALAEPAPTPCSVPKMRAEGRLGPRPQPFWDAPRGLFSLRSTRFGYKGRTADPALILLNG